MQPRTIIMYGQSLLLALITASISQNQHLHVLLADSWEGVVTLSATCHPDVLVFDLPSASAGHLLTLLSTHPRLKLIGLDVETNQAILLAGQATGNLTLEWVKEILQSSAK